LKCVHTHAHTFISIYKLNMIILKKIKIKILALSYFEIIFPAIVCRKFSPKA
jgi:hypothetical protein